MQHSIHPTVRMYIHAPASVSIVSQEELSSSKSNCGSYLGNGVSLYHIPIVLLYPLATGYHAKTLSA